MYVSMYSCVYVCIFASTLQVKNFDFCGVRHCEGWVERREGRGEWEETRRTFPVVSDPNSHRWGGVACYKEPPQKKRHDPLQKDRFVFFCLSRGEEEERRERVCKRERDREREGDRERETQKL